MRVKRVIIVAVPPAQELNVVGPLSVFSTANEMLTSFGSDAPRYDVELVSANMELKINSQAGFSIVASRSYSDVDEPVDTLLISGGEGAYAGTSPDFLTWLKARRHTVRRFGSLCTGAFVLADAGLLKGSRVTTHWQFCAALSKRYPDIDVDADPIWVYDKNVYTSAGISAGVDLSLAMVEEDHGSKVALAVARYLVLFLRRPSGQAQLSIPMTGQAAEVIELRDLAVWITNNLRGDLRVDALADRVGMSERNFTRMFAREVGLSPGQYVEQARLELAKRELQTTAASIDEVADLCGYGSREVLRRAFMRHAGVSPSQYRSRFRVRPGSDD
jgi:transcriptional regulator GlxA family with amidase domain